MQPQFASVEDWTRISGLGRTTSYKLLGAGHLRAVKAGRRTLIDVPAGLAWLSAQPAAQIRTGQTGRASA
jgi:hypothetical protein